MDETLKCCLHCGGNAAFIALATCHGYIACIGECVIRTGDYWDDMTKDTENPEKWYEKAVRDWNRRI